MPLPVVVVAAEVSAIPPHPQKVAVLLLFQCMVLELVEKWKKKEEEASVVDVLNLIC